MSHQGQSKDLLSLFVEWKRLTELEGDAIAAGAWGEVAAHQAVKQSLQPLILAADDTSRAASTSPVEATTPRSHQLQSLLDELMQLEERNRVQVELLRRSAVAERAELEKTGRNLRQIRQSYASPNAVHWNQYC